MIVIAVKQIRPIARLEAPTR